ncbi:RxLR effector protein [Phytophthora megakarya]|uniref:RxLR effector protein n=1 Tax=Phytophthora megakarya TaxID=4795 RepID=A0A225V4Q0_9STRA|nr:RxLR effector protein [Phytophthora megakarya]
MRLVLCVLLATLITFLSLCEADANKWVQQPSVANANSRGDNVADTYGNSKRFLRSGSNKILDSSDEERKFGQKLTNFLKEIKMRFLKWEQKKLVPKFEKLAKEEKTYNDVMKDFQTRMAGTGWWTTPPGFKRYARLYNTWLTKNRPDLATPIR